jgi:hypothetical protein
MRNGACGVCQRRANAKWNEAHPEKRMWNSARHRARKTGVPFSIKVEDVSIPTHCPALGIPLFRSRSRRGPCPNSPSLDRLDPALGYVKGNVVVISNIANTIKQNATSAAILAVGRWLESRGL